MTTTTTLTTELHQYEECEDKTCDCPSEHCYTCGAPASARPAYCRWDLEADREALPPRAGASFVRHGPYVNATTKTGMIHASQRDGYPVCGRYLRGILYTADPVDCPKCLRKETR